MFKRWKRKLARDLNVSSIEIKTHGNTRMLAQQNRAIDSLNKRYYALLDYLELEVDRPEHVPFVVRKKEDDDA